MLSYASSIGKTSFAGIVPDNAYGSVVEAAFREDVARRGGRVVALERYPSDKAKLADARQAAKLPRVQDSPHARRKRHVELRRYAHQAGASIEPRHFRKIA